MGQVAIEARRALYYPFIHPRDADWVKGTILAFGQLNRLVPTGYVLHDLPEVAEFTERAGTDGEPLLDGVSPRLGDIANAQRRLIAGLEVESAAALEVRFGYDATQRSEVPFQIHRDKLSMRLIEWLEHHQLSWSADDRPRHSHDLARRSPRGNPDDWYSVHPDLGRAIMAIIAIAAARNRGLDVVTEAVDMHAPVAAMDEDHVVAALLDLPGSRSPAVPVTQTTDQLVHVVMTTGFDMSQLSVDDIASLVADGMDLRRFKVAAAQMAVAIPADAAPTVRDARLRQLAADLLAQWEQYSRGLTPRIRAILHQSGTESAKKLFDDAGKLLAK